MTQSCEVREVPSSASGFVDEFRFFPKGRRVQYSALRTTITFSQPNANGHVWKDRLSDCWVSSHCRARKVRFERNPSMNIFYRCKLYKSSEERYYWSASHLARLSRQFYPLHVCYAESSIAMVTAILTLNFTKLATKNRMALAWWIHGTKFYLLVKFYQNPTISFQNAVIKK